MIDPNNIPRLCCGTFFVLLRRACDPETTDTSTMSDLMKVFRSDFTASNASTLSRYTSELKNCKEINTIYFKLGDPRYLNAFDKQVQSDYNTVLSKMDAFLQSNITNEDNQRWLVGALLELIINDASISENAAFQVSSKGTTFLKRDIKRLNTYHVSAFILGVWHFILLNRKDNTVGKATFDSWHTKTEKNAVGEFTSTIGNNFYSKIRIASTDETRVPRRTSPKRSKLVEEFYSSHKDLLSTPISSLLDDSADPYFKNATVKYSTIKTLLYIDRPKRFYDFYVCNELIRKVRVGSSTINHWEGIESATIRTLIQTCGRHIIITGTGGLGKSMMMRHLLLDGITNRSDFDIIPILVSLKNYNPEKSGLVRYIFEAYTSLGGVMSFDLFERILESDDIVFLLDGIDEIKLEYMNQFVSEVEHFVDKNPFVTVIMSSRPYSSFGSFSKFSILELSPFSLEQAVSLIEKLDFRNDEPSIKENFKNELKTGLFKSHEDFCSIPLLLTIMLMTYEQFAEIPSKMHLFYHEAYVTLSQRHDAIKVDYQRSFKTGLSSGDFADLFAEFCARSYRDEKYEFTEREMKDYYSKLNYIKTHPVQGDHEDFVYDLVNNVCLMYFEGGKYCFTHRSFQEYFCAFYFSNQKDRALPKIGQFFEDKKQTGSNEKTFFMLYDMIPEKVEEYLFLDFLEKLFTETVQSYQDYLKFQYGEISYASGDLADTSTTNPGKSFILRTFLQTHGLFHDSFESLMPFDEGFALTKYVYVADHWDQIDWYDSSDGISEIIEDESYSFVSSDDIPSGYIETFGYPDTAGFELIADVNEIYSDPDTFYEFISVMEDDDFPLKVEYQSLQSEYERLKSKVTRSKQSEDLFDFLG